MMHVASYVYVALHFCLGRPGVVAHMLGLCLCEHACVCVCVCARACACVCFCV